jgi:DNA-binding MarR family transcriptional regulator
MEESPVNQPSEVATMDVERAPFEALRRIMRAVDVHSRALLRDHQLTGPQLSVLKELGRHGRAPIGMLAKNTFLGAPTVTGVVDRLERQGWVTRDPSKQDRRQVLISITDEGRQLLERNPPLLLDVFCVNLKRLSPAEQAQICDVLKRVADMMEQSALAAEPDRAIPHDMPPPS